MYQVKSAVLFLIFNRPNETNIVFEEIKKVKPSRLYIAADGPRNENEKVLCDNARQVIQKVDWECDYKLLLRDSNLGCKNAVSSAISWFFENEDEGIILEDDVKPITDFFRFMDEMLHYYRDDSRVRHVAGYNIQKGIKRGGYSYYFSRWTSVWGWASWKRVWNDYSVSISSLDEVLQRKLLYNITPNKMLVKNIENGLIAVQENKIDTWDIQLFYSNFINNGLCIVPNTNLVENIGFNKSATHTVNFSTTHSFNYTAELDSNLLHPSIYIPDIEADTYTLLNDDNSTILRKLKYKLITIFANGQL